VSIYFLGYLFWTSVSRDLMSRDLKLVNANILTVIGLVENSKPLKERR
jgi:hypothetical protein